MQGGLKNFIPLTNCDATKPMTIDPEINRRSLNCIDIYRLNSAFEFRKQKMHTRKYAH